MNAAQDTSWHQDFTYFGRNCYAYVFSKYGLTPLEDESEQSDAAKTSENDQEIQAVVTSTGEQQTKKSSWKFPKATPTFDLVAIQLYESWSRLNDWTANGGDAKVWLNKWLDKYANATDGSNAWNVDFSSDPSLSYKSHP